MNLNKLKEHEQEILNMSDFERGMRESAAIASSVVGLLAGAVKPGINLLELEGLARKLIADFKAEPFNLGYHPTWANSAYPAATCLSVNGTIAHGIPENYYLKEGDLINIDLSVKFNGYCGDCGMSVPVGKIDEKDLMLLRIANRACYAGIQQVKDGVCVMQIGKAIDDYVSLMGRVTNKVFSGHNIGVEMHGDGILVPNFYDGRDSRYLQKFAGMILKEGQVICIEPMVTYKDRIGKLMGNGWSLVTTDKKNSAMFEHMILVKKNGFEILTDHFKKF